MEGVDEVDVAAVVVVETITKINMEVDDRPVEVDGRVVVIHGRLVRGVGPIPRCRNYYVAWKVKVTGRIMPWIRP